MSTRKYPDDFMNKIICGDCLEVMKEMPNECVDMIFTDPPYNKESISLYEGLAREGARVLKKGGSLLTFCGHYALPEIFNLMIPHLRFWWLIAIKNTSRNPRLPGKWIFVEWKPMLWFVKHHRINNNYVSDFKKSYQRKDYHLWQQGENEAGYYISKLTEENETVLDPFLGGGTTIRATKDLKRNFIGIEINPDYCKIAEERLAQGVL